MKGKTKVGKLRRLHVVFCFLLVWLVLVIILGYSFRGEATEPTLRKSAAAPAAAVPAAAVPAEAVHREANFLKEPPRHDDDDGLEFVRQVIEADHDRKRGEREEWAAKTGWHRKEDIFH